MDKEKKTPTPQDLLRLQKKIQDLENEILKVDKEVESLEEEVARFRWRQSHRPAGWG